MGDKTTIEWCDATWPIANGCRRVSRGCERCYAERLTATRLSSVPKYAGLARMTNGEPRWTGETRLWREHLDWPLRWKRPRRIFVADMGDLFYERVSDEDIAAVFGVMAAAPQHTFLVLTKRAERMRDWFSWCARSAMLPMTPLATCTLAAAKLLRERLAGRLAHLDLIDQMAWPLPNVHIGVSVEDQATADERIPRLLACPAAVRWVSYEPALGPVDFAQWLGPRNRFRTDGPGVDDLDDVDTIPGLNWLVIGGESGPGARPFDLAWARSTIAACRAAAVPCFTKQLGAWPVERMDTIDRRTSEDALADLGSKAELSRLQTIPAGWTLVRLPGAPPFLSRPLRLRDRKGSDPAEWPEDLKCREFPTWR